jgi:multisubunit Na+/H+ antiporter MnhB subunit
MSGTPARDRVVARSLILETAVRLVFHATLAASLFFLFAGHNAPGGGFIGGLVAGAAFVLRYLVAGASAVGTLRARPETALGAGLLLAAGTGAVPWLSGGQLLESSYVSLELPVLGSVSVTSVLAFDTGVFLIVVGLVLMVLTTLGARPESALGDLTEDAAEEHER